MPAKLPADFAETANQRYIEARRFWSNWRGAARDDYAFISGDQWLVDDEAILKLQKRPPITFNYSEKMIDAVVGAEVSSRQEITYAPRKVDGSGLAEMLTNACKWVRDLGNIEDEESDAFRDALICGLGWTHTKVSYENNPEGLIDTYRVDPLEMIPDASARKPGLVDRRFSFRDVWMDEALSKKKWPNAPFVGTTDANSGQGVQHVRQGHHYEDDADEDMDAHKGQVQIRHYECVEMEPFYRVQTEKGLMSVDAGPFAKMQADLDKKNIKYVKMTKKVYYFAYFSGEHLLEGDLSPTQEGFTYGCITGKRDRNKGTWYGLTRVMKDPQRWANKWLSQILHIINSNAKGGLLAEKGAFVDPKGAQDQWAKPDSITLLNEGGINKIKEKQMAGYPSGLDRLMEFALSSLPQVTGINLEALGLAGRDQANVLEQSRKQAAYGLLAPVFDSLRRYRKIQGRILLDFINSYISDGRMIRIGGPDSQKYIPLRKVPDVALYDVIVDQSPNAPDVKRETWQSLQQLIPAALKSGMPIPPTLLKYAPIPTALATEWEKYIADAQKRTSPEAMQQMQQEMQKLQQQNQQLQQQLQDKSKEFSLEEKMAQEESARKQKQQVDEHNMRMQEMNNKFELARIELDRTLDMKYDQARADLLLQKQKQAAELEIKREAVKNQPKEQS